MEYYSSTMISLYYVINNYDEEDGINNEILEYVNNFVDINK